jgi:hypothetical protein
MRQAEVAKRRRRRLEAVLKGGHEVRFADAGLAPDEHDTTLAGAHLIPSP